MRPLFLFLLLLIQLPLSAQLFDPENPDHIKVGPGPEDFVLDTFGNNERLIVACAERRDGQPHHGEFWSVDLLTRKAAIMPRRNEPDSIQEIHPHGLDLVRSWDGKLRLYAISHGIGGGNEGDHILVYIVDENGLTFEAIHGDQKYLKSPNDVTATPEGWIYISNDYGGGMKLIMRFLFKVKASTIAFYDGMDWQLLKGGYRYANGIRAREQQLYLSTTAGGRVFKFRINADGYLEDRVQLVKTKSGLDNIDFDRAGNLLVTRHTNNNRFIKHVKKPEVTSPWELLRLSDNGEWTIVTSDDGSGISAVSTGILYGGNTYLCQVFNGFIKVIPAQR